MEAYPSDKITKEKYIKITDKVQKDKDSDNNKTRFRKKSSQEILFEKSLELKGFEMSGFEISSPQNRQKKVCNFLSPEDEEYVKSLKIQIIPNE